MLNEKELVEHMMEDHKLAISRTRTYEENQEAHIKDHLLAKRSDGIMFDDIKGHVTTS